MRTERVKLKVCLVGERGVGKTSLVRRYVLDAFSDKYVQTLGTKVSKKEVDLFVPQADLRVHALIQVWDIMGHLGFRELLRAAYFHGCQGILAVCDVTDEPTLGTIDSWIDGSSDVTGKIPVHLLVNKSDLEPVVREREVRDFAGPRDMPYLYTSAKRGENVTRAFEDLARRITEPVLQARGYAVGGLLTARP